MTYLRRQFDELGFAIIDTDVTEEMCHRLKKSLSEAFTTNRRLPDYWRHNDDVRMIARNAKVMQALKEIYGADAKPFQTLNFNRGTEQGLHSDAMHFNSDPPGMMCGVWIALEEVTDRNGPLFYCPRSHLLPFYSWADLGQDVEGDAGIRSNVYSRWITAIANERGFVPKTAILRRGQAIIWAANLLHGGAKIVDANSTRWSQVTHYFFAGTSAFVTPLLEVSRQPDWIDA